MQSRHDILARMELDLTDNRAERKTRPWIEVTLISGFIFSLLIGFGALAALVASSQVDRRSVTSSALETLDPEQIVPQLALAQLAGDPAEALAYQATRAGELDTAIAIALTETELTGPQRLSLLLRLGEETLAGGRPDDANQLLNLARAVAILDPTLAELERITALARIAEGLAGGGDEAGALDAAIQSMRATEQTPGLLPAHRSQSYENLRPIAVELDDQAFSQELSELARNPYFEPPGALLDPKLSSITASADYDANVATAIANRMQAARLLADRILLTGGIDILPETQTLASALTREDQFREEFYRRSLSEGLSLEDQYALLMDRRDWISLKARVALQGYGLSLVPEWEQDEQLIRQELGAATANINLVAEALANELPDPVDQTLLRTESMLWLAQQAELDRYPGASLTDLDSRIQTMQSELQRLGHPLSLPVAYDEDASPPGFRINSIR